MNNFFKYCLAKMMGKKDFTTNPYLGLLLEAEEETLIADEFFQISQAYNMGSYGLRVSPKQAVKYNRIAAEQGHACAQFLEASQQAVQGHMQEALEWMHKAAEQGDARAIYNISISLHRGDYGENNKPKSINYLETSAEKDYLSACKRLGQMYMNGLDVEKNFKLARYWLFKAYLQNHDQEIMNLLLPLIDHGYINQGRINSPQIVNEAAEEGCYDAWYAIARKTIKTNEDEGITYLLKAVEKGSHLGLYDLADYYIKQNINISEAIDLLNKAASWGDQQAQIRLSHIYWKGNHGLDKNIKKALFWIEKALCYGEPSARYLFALMNISNDLQILLPDNGIMRGYNYMELAAIANYPPAVEFYKSIKEKNCTT